MGKVTLDGVANIALLIACTVVTAGAINSWTRSSSGVSPPRTYEPGERVQWSADVGRPGRERLVLFLRSTCSYCTDSMPFYRRLSVELRKHDKVELIALGDEPDEILSEYLSRHDLTGVTAVRLPTRDSKLAMTPIVLLVGPSGEVRRAWSGRMDLNQERELLSTIAGL